ncbi:MAG: glycosyltransferase family 4 protein [Dokdonella sp.]
MTALGSNSGMHVAGWMAITFAWSTVVTVLTIRYARRQRMFDLPGQRRSHHVATPRGGGLGIVVAVLVCVLLPMILVNFYADAVDGPLMIGIALLVVATVGWIDDHGGLRARYRFAAHCIAGSLLLVPILEVFSSSTAMISTTGWWTLIPVLAMALVLLLAIVWSINLHNFMDGINGLLASQSIFVFSTLAILGLLFGDSPWWTAALATAAAVVGFLPFNFPKARVFMGDVGSGSLGLLVAVSLLYQLGDHSLDAATGLIACSAFATDATATLLSRMWRRRRWYDAHREHLYQGLVRSGYSHARVVGWYFGWNVLIVLPAMLLIQSPRSVMAVDSYPLQISAQGMVVLLAVYALACATWVTGKRHCLQRARHGRHA